jgi:hypothetical protein
MTTNEAAPSEPARLLVALPLGTRVVVRSRLADAADALYTDALGVLLRIDEQECIVETKRGEVRIRLSDIVATKTVPPPPAPRIRRPAGT